MRLAADPEMVPARSAKLELNRVLMSDPNLETMDGPATFDILWYEQEGMLPSFIDLGMGARQEVVGCDDERKIWEHLIPSSGLITIFVTFL